MVTAVDVGCGRGLDAQWLARTGVRAVGLDYFPPDLRAGVRRAERRGLDVRFEWMNLGELRSVLRAGTWLSREPGPRTVLAHHLVDATDRRGRANLLRLARMVTRSSGRLYLQAYTAPTELSARLGLHPVDVGVVRRAGRGQRRSGRAAAWSSASARPGWGRRRPAATR